MAIKTAKNATQSTIWMKKNLYNSAIYRSLATLYHIYTAHYTVLTDIYIRSVLYHNIEKLKILLKVYTYRPYTINRIIIRYVKGIL